MGGFRNAFALVLTFLLVACSATPELRTDSSDISAKVTAKVPFVSGVAYSPDGTKLATGGHGLIRVWDLRRATLSRVMKGHTSGVFALAFSPDGRTLASVSLDGTTRAWDLATGTQLWQAETGVGFVCCKRVFFSPDGKLVLAYTPHRLGAGEFRLHDARSGALRRTFPGSNARQALATISRHQYQCRHASGEARDSYPCMYQAVSSDGRVALQSAQTISGLSITLRYSLWNLQGGGRFRELDIADEAKGTLVATEPSGGMTADGKYTAVTTLASTRLFEVSTGREIGTLIVYEDGEWLITTPNGYYNASDKGDQYLRVSVAGKAYTVGQLRESFYRPDLVAAALAGRSLSDHRHISDVKAAPLVTIVGAPSQVASDEITLRVRVTDQGGGVGDVRVYLNGSAVVLDNTRNLQLARKEAAGVTLTYNLRLLPEKNVIQAVAFNADNSLRSNDAVAEIEARFAQRPPRLHAIVVGIQEYDNPRLALRYAVADARLVSATLRERAVGLFESVHVTELTTRADTTRDALVQALQSAKAAIRPEDLFVFYVASHGTVDEDEYFLVTSNVGSVSTAALRANALSQARLKELLANIPATKKLIVVDTCNAGKLGEAIEVALMTRGMNEETAMKILSRAVGSTILSASSTVQQAIEGYQGHGLFTWVVVEGLKGAADSDRDGFVRTLELASYVDVQVPELAERVFRHRQYPLIAPSGQGFPVARTQ